MTFYEVNESISEPREVFGTDLSTVQALVAKSGAPVVARDAGTSTSRPLYASASGGTPLTQPILTTNGRIDAYVEGEAPVDLLINYGLSNQYTQRFTPPQRGPAGSSTALDVSDYPPVAPEADDSGRFERAQAAAIAQGRELSFYEDLVVNGVSILSGATLLGPGKLVVSAAIAQSAPLYTPPGSHDIHVNCEIDGNKANISGDPDATGNPGFAWLVDGTVANPCERIYFNGYQHDSKRLGIGFVNVQTGALRGVIEDNDRDGATLYYNCRDIDIGLIVSNCGDDYLGVNSGEGSTVGLCENIRGWIVARGPSSRAKGRALTVRGGRTINLSVTAVDVSQSAVVLSNFGAASLTDFHIHVQAYRPGQGGGVGAEKYGVLVNVGEGGYIRDGKVTGRITGALDRGVTFQNDKATPVARDMAVDLLDLEVDGAVNDGINMDAAGVDDCRLRVRVHGCGGWGFSKTSVGRRIFVEEESEFYSNANGARVRLLGDGAFKARVRDNTGVGVNVFALFDHFDFAPKVWGNGTDYQDDGSHTAIWQGPYRILTGAIAWDPASLADGASETKDITVSGVANGDQVSVAFTSLTNTNWDLIGRVTATDTVTAKLTNRTGGTVNVVSGTLRAEVRKYL